ncbi:MAG: family 20 glycosylhydrolase [Bacteroidales bacterium]|nr:family 20 glycosylhydrolase [Candidatus Cacconaster merdequi]
MKNHLFFVAVLIAAVSCSTPDIHEVIIPCPTEIEVLSGQVSLDESPDPVAVIGENVMDSPEGYELTIDKDGIVIKAGSETGVFYAHQTLKQLRYAYSGRRMPAVHILDAPRFEYRGMHLDVSRHFQGVEFVKKQLEMFASLKLNVFHFHLTDGIGWRLQIDRYPELTDIGAWKPAGWKYGDPTDLFASADSLDAVGGFYTKDDIREILAFADSLHITVIPEIEMFGHSSEVLTIYPELKCKGKTVQESTHPVNEFCIGNEKTFEFLENVLTEVIDLFPSEYIHIGGDEASMRHWAACPLCQKRMKKEGLTDVKELQSYGIARIEKFVNGKGRQIIGWEEIAKGGIAPNAALMSWRGVEAGQQATSTGHKVVFCPEPYCYFDAYQDEPIKLPEAMTNYVSLENTYSFDPAEGDFEGKDLIWGVQANLWTERVEEASHAEMMYYPRTFALAEVAWSLRENMDYDNFRKRAIRLSDKAREDGYTVFDLRTETGPRPGSVDSIEHLAVGASVTYADDFHNSDQFEKKGILTDGKCGPWSHRYPGWDTFAGTDADVTVDLGSVLKIKNIETSFASYGVRYGYFPLEVKYEVSLDGVNFETLSVMNGTKAADEKRPDFEKFEWKGRTKARYIRVFAARDTAFATRPGIWGSGRLMLDEVIVR